MPKFTYDHESDILTYDGENEIIISKQDAGVTLTGTEKMDTELAVINFNVQGLYNFKIRDKIKLLWRIWKFIK